VNGISPPNRSQWAEEANRLSSLDDKENRPRIGRPNALPIDAIKQSPALFQVRYDSIAFAPGHSEKHILNLGGFAAKGQALDPVKVVAFGTNWFLVDGHHRLEAYRRAGWKLPVPVEALQSDLRGRDRVNWAAQAIPLPAAA
jgi:hypothetical protein